MPFSYNIRRSQRTKKTRIIVSIDKIEVVAPFLVSARKIHKFVESQQDWILSAADKIELKKKAVKKLAPEKYVNGVSVPYLGKSHKLWIKQSLSNNVKILNKNNDLTIYLPEKYIGTDNNEFIKQALSDWMKKQMLNEVECLVQFHAKQFSLYPRYIRIKTQKSRWGSCGIHNDINLNWLLILAPPEVMEYVVVHELCHIKERNHSDRFWQLVKAHMHDYQVHRKWLKKNGSSLMQGL